jgi:hypothetical protein
LEVLEEEGTLVEVLVLKEMEGLVEVVVAPITLGTIKITLREFKKIMDWLSLHENNL